MGDITDTSKAKFIYGVSSPGLIEAMEARGQREVVASTRLPIEGSDDPALLALGFTFGASDGDLFREAVLPAGWRKVGGDHAMWSYVEDGRGIRRVSVFYKAAWYDRSANMNVLSVGYMLADMVSEGAEVPWDQVTSEEKVEAVECLRARVKRIQDQLVRYNDPEDERRMVRVKEALEMLCGVNDGR